jgi:D-alanyl-D-alanine carboxypeptidase
MPNLIQLRVAVAALLASHAAALGAQQAPPSLLAGRIDSLVHGRLRESGTAGAVVLVRKGSWEHQVLYGRPDTQRADTLTSNTVFRLQSITKQFVAAAILRLVERGAVRLDAPVKDYLSDVGPLGRHLDGVTVRHLLTHQSGLVNYTDLVTDFGKPFTRSDVLALLASQPRAFDPGTRHAYSNSGYFLLGLVVERASGRPLWDYLRREVLEPAGLTAIRECSAPSSGPRATGHAVDSAGRAVPRAAWGGTLAFGATGLCSSATDLARWAERLHWGALLAPESYRAMHTGARLADASETTYGFGQQLDRLDGRRVLRHGGFGEGFQTLLEVYPADTLVIVVLANTAPSRGVESRIARDLVGILSPSRMVAQREPGSWVTTADVAAERGGVVRPMGTGHHITADGSGRYFPPNAAASSSASITMTVARPPVGLGPPGELGVILATASGDQWVEFMLLPAGQFAVRLHDPAGVTTLVEPRAHDALQPRKAVAVTLAATDSIRASLNGEVVASIGIPEALRAGMVAGLRNRGAVDSHLVGLATGASSVGTSGPSR